MKNQKQIIILFLIITQFIVAQTTSFKGTVREVDNGKPIEGVTVLIMELQLITTSDALGNYSFNKLYKGKYKITFSRVGYKLLTKTIFIDGKDNSILNISLTKSELLLGEAVVTSTRSIRIIKDVPLPIDVIDASTIEQSIKVSTSDVIEKAPGVSLVSDGTWATGVNIRGLSKQNVVYLIDGNRIETSTNLTAGLSLIDISNVESIEIVKGGLSSLFGTGATGGVINIKTHQSSINDSFLLSGALSSSFASVNNGKVVSLRLNASDKIWFATFATTMRNADDTKIPSGILTNSGFKDNSLSVSGGFLPIENLELKFNYQKFNATDVGIPGGTPFPTGAKASYPTASRELYSGEIVIKQLSKTVNNLKFKYYSQIIKREVEIIPNPNVIVAPQANHKTNGLLLQANCTFAKNHFLISGIEWWQRSYIGERSKTIIPKKKVIIDKPVPNSKFATLGFFVNDELHLFQNRLKLNIGGRYDFIRVTNEKTNNPIAIITNGVVVTPPPNIDASYDAYSVDNKSWSGNIGILYSLFEDVNLTFNSAYTFRSPSLEERYQYIDLGSTVYYGNPNLEPEQGQSFDFGFRVWKENLTFTIDGFVNIFDNLVIDQPISDTSFQKQNVGKARFIGFDTKIEYNFYKRYVAYASLAYVDGKDTEANESLPQIPPLNGSLGIKIPIQNFLIIDFASTFYNKQNKISSNEKRTPGYIYFDFALNSYPIRFSLLDIQIFAGVENIFDVAYKSHLSTYRGINLTEPGRNIYAKVKLSW